MTDAARFQQHERHCRLADEVLSAWFDDARFRAAWAPELGLFPLRTQKIVARIAASRGEALDLDGLVLALDRSGDLSAWEGGAEGVYRQLRAPFAIDPWLKLIELRQLAGLRALRERLCNAVTDIDGGGSLDEVRARVSEAARAADETSGAQVRTVRQLVGVAYEQATSPRRQGGQRTLSKRLDGATGGLLPGVVWVTAAGTSWGKTSFLVAVANQVLKDGRRPLIVSCEDPPALFGRRILQLRTGVSALRLREGTLLDTEQRYVADAYERSEDLPAFIDGIGRPAEAIAGDIRSLVRSEAISVVLVDYVQAMRPREKQQDRRLDVYYCSRLVTDAIKESGAAGIIFSQLSEDSSTGKLRARDCEDLHNAAEVLIFGRSEEETELGPHGEKRGKLVKRFLWVDKVKEGPAKFRVDLTWESTSACFLSDYETGRNEQLFDEEYR